MGGVKAFPVRVVWLTETGKIRSKGFHMIDAGKRFASKLREDGESPSIFVQSQLFETTEDGSARAYDPRYEIPF